MSLVEKLKMFVELKSELEEALGADAGELEIQLDRKWDLEYGIMRYDQYAEGDRDEYGGFTVSSYGNKGEKLFITEKDGFTILNAYYEDGNWDEARTFIFKTENRVEIDE